MEETVDPRKNLGKKIREKREEMGLSQTELANLVNKVSPAYIAYIESGNRNISTMDLMRLAKVLNTTVSDLLGERENKDNNRPEFLQALRSSADMKPLDKKRIEEFYWFLKEERLVNARIINDQTEPRYSFATLKATEIWKDLCNQEIPVVLNDIIQKLGIIVKSDELDIDGISRVDKDGICFIMYNQKMSVVRQRFTVAHEIGHIVLDHIPIEGNTSQLSSVSQEKEANTFAGELLVPSSDIKMFMKDGTKNIQDIMERYQVSKEAAAIAIQRNKLLNKVKI